MTRKRFVKLLMSQGVSRNRAQEIAECERQKGSYLYAYTMRMGSSLDSLSETLKRFSETVSRIASSIAIATSAFSSALSVAMEEPGLFEGKCHRCGGTGVERQMQSLAQIGGPSVRGPDKIGICPACFGTGRNILKNL